MFFKIIFPSVENCLISNSGLSIFHLVTYFPLWDKYYGIKNLFPDIWFSTSKIVFPCAKKKNFEEIVVFFVRK